MVDIKWLIGALVVFVLAITVIIPTAITSGNNVTPQGTASAELWEGTAATAHPVTYKPVVSVTAFKKAVVHTTYNDTKLVGANGARTLNYDLYTANSGTGWDDINITFTIAGINATNNVTWVAGTCRPQNATWTTSPQTYTVASSCLSVPGTWITFTFTNKTLSETNIVNVTNITMSYFAYDDNSAYTLASAAGEFTPTATGNYYTSYTYGSTSSTSTQIVLLLLPLLIAVVVLLLFIRSSGMF
jgi:hypothetical protein